MLDGRRNLLRLILYLACCEILASLFCAFIVLAAAGYRAGVAAESVRASFRKLAEMRDFGDPSVAGHVLVVWLIATAVLGFLAITGVIFVIRPGGMSGKVDVYRQMDAEKTPPGSYESSGLRLSPCRPASGIWRGASIACVLLATASLSLYAASLVGYFLSPVVYSVDFVFAFALGVGSGFGGVSSSGTAGVRSTGWLDRFKAAPLWMQLAILLTGALLAFVCVRTGYGALVDPSLYSSTVGSANLAAVASFLFFVDALAFRPA